MITEQILEFLISFSLGLAFGIWYGEYRYKNKIFGRLSVVELDELIGDCRRAIQRRRS